MPLNDRDHVKNIVRIAIVILALATAACSESGDDGTEFSERALQGREVARSNGCAACHGNDGQGTIGPAWVSLLDSPVVLIDGTTVTADSAYIRGSITDPGSQIVEGFTIEMPVVELTDDEVDALVAYIEELG